MRRQISDLLLGAVALGDIERNRHQPGLALIRQRPRFDHDFDQVAAGGLVDDGFLQRPSWLRRSAAASAEVVLRHREQFFARIAVMAAHRRVDRQQLPGVGIRHPHRQRVLLEQQPERSLAAFQVGNIDTDADAAAVRGPPFLDPSPSVARQLLLVGALRQGMAGHAFAEPFLLAPDGVGILAMPQAGTKDVVEAGALDDGRRIGSIELGILPVPQHQPIVLVEYRQWLRGSVPRCGIASGSPRPLTWIKINAPGGSSVVALQTKRRPRGLRFHSLLA